MKDKVFQNTKVQTMITKMLVTKLLASLGPRARLSGNSVPGGC